jgi:hypothetical protein
MQFFLVELASQNQSVIYRSISATYSGQTVLGRKMSLFPFWGPQGTCLSCEASTVIYCSAQTSACSVLRTGNFNMATVGRMEVRDN